MSEESGSDDGGVASRQALPDVLGAALSLGWAGIGPLFAKESAHFGPGFGPLLLWYVSIPVIALLLLAATVYKFDNYLDGRYGERASKLSMALWPLATLVYFGIGLYPLIA